MLHVSYSITGCFLIFKGYFAQIWNNYKKSSIGEGPPAASLPLDGHDLIHPALVAPPLKAVGEEGGHDLPGQERPHHAGPQGQHVGVVVAAGQTPMPVVQMTMPRSQVSAATARAAAWAKSG